MSLDPVSLLEGEMVPLYCQGSDVDFCGSSKFVFVHTSFGLVWYPSPITKSNPVVFSGGILSLSTRSGLTGPTFLALSKFRLSFVYPIRIRQIRNYTLRISKKFISASGFNHHGL